MAQEFELIGILDVGQSNVMYYVSFKAEQIFVLSRLGDELCFGVLEKPIVRVLLEKILLSASDVSSRVPCDRRHIP